MGKHGTEKKKQATKKTSDLENCFPQKKYDPHIDDRCLRGSLPRQFTTLLAIGYPNHHLRI